MINSEFFGPNDLLAFVVLVCRFRDPYNDHKNYIKSLAHAFRKVVADGLTLTRPIGLPPHAPISQKIADQR